MTRRTTLESSVLNGLVSTTAGASLTSAEATGADLPCVQVVITGHVDHGKSTVVGRLLADSGSLPTGKLEQLRDYCARNAKPFEYAFLLDALKDERAQGITMDAARAFFRTQRRRYILIDAPGHVEFLKNMVTGASRADAALLVIDAYEGIRENSRRHLYLLSMLGIRQVIVIVNKMDLVEYQQRVYDDIVSTLMPFLDRVRIRPAHVIPVAAQAGDNITQPSTQLAWYAGPTVLEALEQLQVEVPAAEAPLRLPVQAIYKFTEQGDTRRIVAGTIESGRLRVGDVLTFYPSGKTTTVASIEAFNRSAVEQAEAGEATGFTMTDQVYVTRGEVATLANDEPPYVTTKLRANVFWLGKTALRTTKEYQLKLGTARVAARLASIERVIDASQLEPVTNADFVGRHQVAECTFDLERPLAFDVASELGALGRFVIVDDFEIAGGGIIQEALPDQQTGNRERVLQRATSWDASRISETRRAERYSQRAVLLMVTGPAEANRKGFARACEARLFEEGRFVYFLGMGNLVHGLDTDLSRTSSARPEHLRRLGEVANILLDAGLIVVAAAADLTGAEIESLRTAVGHRRLCPIWLGRAFPTDWSPALHLSSGDGTERIKSWLEQSGYVYRAWQAD